MVVATRATTFEGKEILLDPLEGRAINTGGVQAEVRRFGEKSRSIMPSRRPSRRTKFSGVLDGRHPALTPAARCGGATTFALDIHRPITSSPSPNFPTSPPSPHLATPLLLIARTDIHRCSFDKFPTKLRKIWPCSHLEIWKGRAVVCCRRDDRSPGSEFRPNP